MSPRGLILFMHLLFSGNAARDDVREKLQALLLHHRLGKREAVQGRKKNGKREAVQGPKKNGPSRDETHIVKLCSLTEQEIACPSTQEHNGKATVLQITQAVYNTHKGNEAKGDGCTRPASRTSGYPDLTCRLDFGYITQRLMDSCNGRRSCVIPKDFHKCPKEATGKFMWTYLAVQYKCPEGTPIEEREPQVKGAVVTTPQPVLEGKLQGETTFKPCRNLRSTTIYTGSVQVHNEPVASVCDEGELCYGLVFPDDQGTPTPEGEQRSEPKEEELLRGKLRKTALLSLPELHVSNDKAWGVCLRTGESACQLTASVKAFEQKADALAQKANQNES
mmetsp:Transcript_9663/g.28516  ORF Transcript_9663/g.28516 Transcript_9663/m.28516 type:complete len:335 (+) Transcript_9663:52-1056(+)